MNMQTHDYIDSLIKNDTELSRFKNQMSALHIPVITDDVLQLIKTLIVSNQIKSILEIGTAVGASSMLFAEMIGKEASITTIERDDHLYLQAQKNIQQYNFEEQITILHGDATELLPTMNASFDMVFLDGAKAHYIHLLDDCLRVLKPQGLLIADNVLFRGMISGEKPLIRRKITIVKRMRKFLDEIHKRNDLVSTVLPIGDGVSITVKK